MPRYLKVAAAQMGPNQDGTPREAIVDRMLSLLDAAARDGVELIVYPEMALTTYFPKRIRTDFDQFFETEMPPKALEPLLRRAAAARVAVHVGFCEKADGKYFNTALLTDRDGRLCGTFRIPVMRRSRRQSNGRGALERGKPGSRISPTTSLTKQQIASCPQMCNLAMTG